MVIMRATPRRGAPPANRRYIAGYLMTTSAVADPPRSEVTVTEVGPGEVVTVRLQVVFLALKSITP